MPGRGDQAKLSRNEWLMLGAILLIAAIYRFWNLGGPSLWIDEISSVSFAHAPFGLMWSDWMVYETNPPLYYVLLGFWINVFGESEAAVRALSVVCGLGAVAAMFAFARTLHSTLAGLLAAAFTAVAAEQVGYSQETRGYMLGFLAAVLAVWALLRLADRWRAGASPLRDAWGDYTLYALASIVALYTHTTFFLLPVLANLFIGWLWLFRTPRRINDALAWVAANVVVAAFYAWWILITLRQIQAGAETVSWIDKPTIKDIVAVTSHIVATRSFEIANLLFAAAFGAVIAWGAWKLPLERRALAIVFGAAGPFLLIAISFVKPIFMERTLFWMQFIYLACLAVGVLELPWKRWRWAAAGAIALIMIADGVVWKNIEYREDWRGVAAVLDEHAGPNDALITYSAAGAVNFDYYCRRNGCGEVDVIAMETPRGKRGLGQFFEGPEVDAETVGAAIRSYDHVWVIARTEDDPTTILGAAARQEGGDRLNDPTGRMRLTLWATPR